MPRSGQSPAGRLSVANGRSKIARPLEPAPVRRHHAVLPVATLRGPMLASRPSAPLEPASILRGPIPRERAVRRSLPFEFAFRVDARQVRLRGERAAASVPDWRLPLLVLDTGLMCEPDRCALGRDCLAAFHLAGELAGIADVSLRVHLAAACLTRGIPSCRESKIDTRLHSGGIFRLDGPSRAISRSPFIVSC